jgi:chromosome segregation ATPase
VEDDQIIS